MSRELKFRLWDNNAKKWLSEGESLTQKLIWNFTPELSLRSDVSGVIEQCTALKDRNGKEIYEGDILEFDDEDGVWRASVVFERGLYGLDVHHPKQVKNPDGWDKDYDKVESRGWAVSWGYEETGTAFTYRTPLAKATIFSGSPEEYEKSGHHERYKKFGYDSYYVDAENIGNIHENPELLGGEE